MNAALMPKAFFQLLKTITVDAFMKTRVHRNKQATKLERQTHRAFQQKHVGENAVV